MATFNPARVVNSFYSYTTAPSLLNDGADTPGAELQMANQTSGSYSDDVDLFVLDMGSVQSLSAIQFINVQFPSLAAGVSVTCKIFGSNSARPEGASSVLLLSFDGSTSVQSISGNYRYIYIGYYKSSAGGTTTGTSVTTIGEIILTTGVTTSILARIPVSQVY